MFCHSKSWEGEASKGPLRPQHLDQLTSKSLLDLCALQINLLPTTLPKRFFQFILPRTKKHSASLTSNYISYSYLDLNLAFSPFILHNFLSSFALHTTTYLCAQLKKSYPGVLGASLLREQWTLNLFGIHNHHIKLWVLEFKIIWHSKAEWI